MKVFIAGASGFIGQHLVSACLLHGLGVVACVRDKSAMQQKFPGIDVVYGDYSLYHHHRNWAMALQGVDVVTNAVGIFSRSHGKSFDNVHNKSACALFKASEIAGVKKIIQISALGADDSATSEYHLSKKNADDYLSSLNINWVIFRPSIVYGPGAKSMSFFTALAGLPVTPLYGKGEQQVQPIHVDDLCEGIIAAIKSNQVSRQCIDAVGPRPLSMRELFTLLKASLGKTTCHFVNISPKFSYALAYIAGAMGSTMINPQALRMLDRGNTSNSSAFQRKLKIAPRTIGESFVWQPLTTTEVVCAGDYFLIRALKYSLALMWVATGIISAFVYPVSASLELLEQVGIDAAMGLYVLYFASALDVALGVGLLLKRTMRAVIYLQLMIVMIYTVIITVMIPEWWLHPFGPIIKNIPLVFATLLLLSSER